MTTTPLFSDVATERGPDAACLVGGTCPAGISGYRVIVASSPVEATPGTDCAAMDR